MNEEDIEKVNKVCREIIARQQVQEQVGSFIRDIWGMLEDYKYNVKSLHETFDALFKITTNKFMQLHKKEQEE